VIAGGGRRVRRRRPDDGDPRGLGSGSGASAGAATAGDAILGSASLGLYAVAIVGIGVAVVACGGRRLAAEIAALVVVATYLVDLLAPPLNLPDWVHQLALTAHLGQPMWGDGTSSASWPV